MSWITANFNLKLLSLVIAALAWLAVVYSGNPVAPPKTLTNISIARSAGPPANLDLLTDPSATKLTATIDGLQSAVNAYRPDRSLHASVDLSGLHAGHNSVPIAVQNLDSTVTLQDYKPTSIDLIADVDQQQTVKVQAEATGQPAGCCDKSGAPTASPDSVSLRGPKSLLAQARVIASIDVTGKAATVSLEARVQILDARGRALSQVTATPPKVTVTQQINLVKLQKVVAVTPTISGAPAPGFRITSIDYSPLTLDPSGAQNDVQNLTSLTTDAIEISGATADVVRTVNVKLPAGVTLTPPETGRITVHIHIASETTTPSPSASP